MRGCPVPPLRGLWVTILTPTSLGLIDGMNSIVASPSTGMLDRAGSAAGSSPPRNAASSAETAQGVPERLDVARREVAHLLTGGRRRHRDHRSAMASFAMFDYHPTVGGSPPVCTFAPSASARRTKPW
jgi:hypothetical protein